MGVTVHELKTSQDFYPDVASGRKPFEIRKNDRNFNVKDILRLREIKPCYQCNSTGRVTVVRRFGPSVSERCPTCSGRACHYTGRSCDRLVTYITNFEQKEGFVVMGLDGEGTNRNPPPHIIPEHAPSWMKKRKRK